MDNVFTTSYRVTRVLPDEIHTYDLLRPMNPEPPRPRTNEPVSVHVLDGDDTVLFGTGFESGLEQLVPALDAFGGPDVVVVEHGDPDHYDALPALVERYDPTIAVPAQDAGALEDVGVTVDVALDDDETRWGVRTIHVPGHTAGNMSFLHEDTGTLFAGDTVVHSNSFAAAPGSWSGEFAPIKPSLNADNRAARENVSVLAEYSFDAALLTHGLNAYSDARSELDTLLEDLGR